VLDLHERLKDIGKRLLSSIREDVEIVIVTNSAYALVQAEPRLVDMILVNLASNANDAMPHGGKLLLETSEVELDEDFTQRREWIRAGKYILLTASDNGIGMDRATLAFCFDPFFTTKELGKGDGLGLPMVFGIVRHSGGDIFVHSDLGHGTTVKVYLPSAEHEVGIVPLPHAKS
jgi:signal transduction histidine kinase